MPSLQEEANQAFEKRLDEIITLYNEGKDNRDKTTLCIAKTRNLLAFAWAPRLVRVETIIILGAALPYHDWDEADICQMEAERLWSIEREVYPEGQDKVRDEFLAIVRKSLNELQESMAKEFRERWGSDHPDSEDLDSDDPDSVSEAATARESTSPAQPPNAHKEKIPADDMHPTALKDKASAAQLLAKSSVTTKPKKLTPTIGVVFANLSLG